MTENKKTNPYKLIWYRQDWSQAKTERNNNNFWKWEIEHNGFIPPNSGPNLLANNKTPEQ